MKDTSHINVPRVRFRGSVGYMPVDVKMFSSGELLVGLNYTPDTPDGVDVAARIQSSDDLMALVLLTDVLDRDGRFDRTLYIPKFPYAQQDRVMWPLQSFSLAAVARIINSLKYREVFIDDPHSDVTPALIDRCIVRTQAQLVASFSPLMELLQRSRVSIVCPDAGAFKKVSAVAARIGYQKPIIIGTKTRDGSTGQLDDFCGLHGEINPKHAYVIIDDICDGGATFISLARAIRQKAPDAELYLYVTHLIASRGLDPLRQWFTRIFTTASWQSPHLLDRDFVVVRQMEDLT